jgi:hypothetical protein
VKSDIGKSHRLTASVVARRLRAELEALGFVLTKEQPSAAAQRMMSELKSHGVVPPAARPLKLVRKINDQSEVFIYPGVQKKGASILIDPVIGLENTILRERALAMGWDGSTRVCHAHLGLKASWDRFYVQTEQELDAATTQVVKAVVEIGLPMMSAYDTLDKVRQLFRDELDRTKQVRVAVLFAEQKLKLIEAH